MFVNHPNVDAPMCPRVVLVETPFARWSIGHWIRDTSILLSRYSHTFSFCRPSCILSQFHKLSMMFQWSPSRYASSSPLSSNLCKVKAFFYIPVVQYSVRWTTQTLKVLNFSPPGRSLHPCTFGFSGKHSAAL